jgi:hypothetical protein
MRNALRIMDSRPNVPSAMFLASADELEASRECRDAICTVSLMNNTYRWQFAYHGEKLNRTKTTRGVRL